MVLFTPWLVGSSWIRDHVCGACIGRWTPNHWTTREVPKIWLLKGVIEREKIEPIHPLRDPDKTLDWFLLLASLEFFPEHHSALTPLVCESLHSLLISPFVIQVFQNFLVWWTRTCTPPQSVLSFWRILYMEYLLLSMDCMFVCMLVWMHVGMWDTCADTKISSTFLWELGLF